MTKRLIAVATGLVFVLSCSAADAKSRSKRAHYKSASSYHHNYRHHYRSHRQYVRTYGKRTRVAKRARSTTYAKRTLRGYAAGGMTADRGCLTAAAKGLLARIEANFGRVQVISTCRRGATIAGTAHPSMHRYGMAFDFKTSRKAEVVRWLMANNSGGTMTYRGSDHIHADVGRYKFASIAGSRSRVASRATRRAYAAAPAVQPTTDLAGGSGYSDGAQISQPRVARSGRGVRYRSYAYAGGQQLVMYRQTRRQQRYAMSVQRSNPQPHRQTHSAM
jgi:Peptidase M15